MPGNLIFRWIFLRNYIVFALFLSLAHFAVLYYFYQIPFTIALTDALVCNILLDFILLSLWFVVKFARSASVTSFSSFRNSAIAGLLLVFFWLFLIHQILSFLFESNSAYLEFLEDSLLIRFIIGLFITALVYLSFFLSIYQESVKQSLLLENELRLLVQQTELQALKNQLNPHFIYNSLNSISSLTLYSPDKAREMVVMLSDFLRIALRQDAIQLVSLEEELNNITLYLKIEKIRFEDKMDWEFRVPKDLLQISVPVLILQPLFENAVKHGIQQRTEPGKIILYAEKSQNALIVRIQNGFDPYIQKYRGEGVGLANVKNRIRLIYGHTASLNLNITDHEGIFEVQLKIPI